MTEWLILEVRTIFERRPGSLGRRLMGLLLVYR